MVNTIPTPSSKEQGASPTSIENQGRGFPPSKPSPITAQEEKIFKTTFREHTGLKARIGTKTGEQLLNLKRAHGMSTVVDAIPRWVEDEGGREKLNKKWAFVNFLRDAEELIEAMKAGVFDKAAQSYGELPRLVVHD